MARPDLPAIRISKAGEQLGEPGAGRRHLELGDPCSRDHDADSDSSWRANDAKQFAARRILRRNDALRLRIVRRTQERLERAFVLDPASIYVLHVGAKVGEAKLSPRQCLPRRWLLSIGWAWCGATERPKTVTRRLAVHLTFAYGVRAPPSLPSSPGCPACCT